MACGVLFLSLHSLVHDDEGINSIAVEEEPIHTMQEPAGTAEKKRLNGFIAPG
jgi:hypothetical protein